ncbi:MAG: hypothetical protein IPK87_00695 [Planctomycetes bacterium]|nr:hypothetical protein [Planctomycetota bacterium]
MTLRKEKDRPIFESLGGRGNALAGLTVKQTKALTAILAGKNNKEAAQAAGVRRETVSHWRNHHSPFQTHLLMARAELFAQIVQSVWSEGLESIRYLAGVRNSKFASIDQRMRAAQVLLKSAAWPTSAMKPTVPDAQITSWRELARAEDDEANYEEMLALVAEIEEFDPERRYKEVESLRSRVQELENGETGEDHSNEEPNPKAQEALALARFRLQQAEAGIRRYELRLTHLRGNLRYLEELDEASAGPAKSEASQ